MRVIDLNQQPREEWRSGVLTRMRTSAVNGGAQLCIFEQWCEIGHGAPTHLHAVEEILRVLDGQADVWIGEDHATLTSGQLVIVPAGHKHGFSNNGTSVLHIESTLAAPVFEAAYATSARRRAAGCPNRAPDSPARLRPAQRFVRVRLLTLTRTEP